jgi:hypothetical protein
MFRTKNSTGRLDDVRTLLGQARDRKKNRPVNINHP